MVDTLLNVQIGNKVSLHEMTVACLFNKVVWDSPDQSLRDLPFPRNLVRQSLTRAVSLGCRLLGWHRQVLCFSWGPA